MIVLRYCGAHAGSTRAMQYTNRAHSASWREIRRPSPSSSLEAIALTPACTPRTCASVNRRSTRAAGTQSALWNGAGSESGCVFAKTSFGAACARASSVGSSAVAGGAR